MEMPIHTQAFRAWLLDASARFLGSSGQAERGRCPGSARVQVAQIDACHSSAHAALKKHAMKTKVLNIRWTVQHSVDSPTTVGGT
jgi:hypothetical protein